jgi:ABC-2 type transport system permease protein
MSIYLKHYFNHKANIFAKIVYVPINCFVLGLVWWIVALYNPDISYRNVISYYFVDFIISSMFPFARFAREIQDDIMEGKLTNFLIRPTNYMVSKISYCLSWCIIYIVIIIPFIYLYCIVTNLNVSFMSFVIFLFFVLGGMFINFLLWFYIGLLSFWTGKNLGIIKINYTISQLFSASLIPYMLLPYKVKTVFNLFPYKYILYFPVNIILSSDVQLTIIYKNILLLITWITVLYVLVKYTFRKGVRRYEANLH